MRDRLSHLGYIEVNPAPGELARGHQFRYSEIDPMPESIYRPYSEAFQVRSTVGSYVHLHFLSCPGFAKRLFMR
jgi:cobyrinic acid a,c-diamide synthase